LDPLIWAAVFILVTSFLANVSPFVGGSYTLIATLQLILVGFSPTAFIVVVVVSAVGATAAKVVIYFGAFGLKKYIVRNKNVRLFSRYTSNWGMYVVLFVAAFLPVFPFDDFLFVGAGATSMSLGLMSTVTLGAKILKSAAEIGLEFTVLRGVSEVLGANQLWVSVALTAVFILLGAVLFKVDWEGVLRRAGVKVPGAQLADAPAKAL
jgi:hypothetical protein